MGSTQMKATYLPNPTNTERPEVKISLYYWAGKGYSIYINGVKRESGRGYGTELSSPMEARTVRAGEHKRRSQARDAEALNIFADVVLKETAKIEAEAAAVPENPADQEAALDAFINAVDLPQTEDEAYSEFLHLSGI